MDHARAAEELRRFFEISLDLIGIAGTDGYFKEIGRAWERALGYTREELLSTPFVEFVHPEDRAHTAAVAAEAFGGSDVVSFENRYRCRDGSYRWLEWRSASYPGESLVYFVARDITERKQLEAAQEESRAQLRSILDTLPAFVMMLDRERRIVFTSRVVAGLTTEQVIGASAFDFIPQETHDVARRAFEETWRTGKPSRFETLGLADHGTIAWYTSYVGPIFKDGEVVSLTVATENIAERKAAEQARVESEARFRAAVEGSLDAFFVFTCDRDDAGKIVDFVISDVNARAAETLGLPRAELLGQRLCALRPVNRTDGFFDRYVRVFQTGESFEEERPVVLPSGDTKWVHHQVVPLPDGVALTSRDITRHKRLAEELRDALEQARTLSAPIIKAWKRVLVLPVIGALDRARAEQMMEKLLTEIVRTRARFAVLDLTGVDAADASTVDHLLRIVRATRLLGSRCLISGISPTVAMTMAEVSPSTEGVMAFGLLEDALRHALLSTGALQGLEGA